MSSVGQGVGMVVGAVIGFYTGGASYVALGAAVGGAIGGAIDPPKGPKGKPPSASELKQQTAAYGVYLGRGYGTYGRYGNVFWIQGNTLTARETEAEGGKGGAKGPSTYEIFGTFAVGFGEGEIDGFSRVWFSGKLVYDRTSSSLGSILASAEAGGSLTFYTGSATQMPDPTIQAELGAANTPAWRGMPYILVKDWPMADFGNTLAGLQVKVEIINGPETENDQQQAQLIQPPTDGRLYTSYRYTGGRIVITTLTYLTWNYDLISVHQQEHIAGSSVCVPLSDVAIDAHHDLAFQSKIPLYVLQTDIDCVMFALYRNTPTYIGGYDTSGRMIMDSGMQSSAVLPYQGYNAVVDRGWVFLTQDNEKIYKLPLEVAGLTPLTVQETASTYHIEQFGVSENYLFAVLFSISSPTSCTVYQFDRGTLGLVDTYTQPVSGTYALITVLSDTEFYTIASDGLIWRWNSGVASYSGLSYSGPHSVANRLIVAYTGLAWLVDYNDDPPTIHACWNIITPQTVTLGSIVNAECLNSGLLESGDIDTSLLTQEVRGYSITSHSSIRTILEPLRAAWPFDAIAHGYQIKFIPRGGSSVATITSDKLAATDGEQIQPMVTISREMDAQLPRKVMVVYSDVNRDYDQNSGPGSERLNTDAVDVLSIDLGSVMNATEAAGVEEVLLYMYWLERNDVSFVLPPTYLNLEPSDIITITTDAASYELRLTQTNILTDGRVECQAKMNRSAIYTPAAVAQESLSPGQVLTYAGPANLVLLDVPAVVDDMDATGLLVGVGGMLDGWTGGTLFRSADNGQTWSDIHSFTTGMVSGVVIDAIGDGRTDIIDAVNVMSIRLHAGDIYSVSQAALFNGSNWFAYGADQRWEIIGIQNVTAETDGSLTCSNLLRGRCGTEWAMTQHAAIDEIVLLDIDTQYFARLASGDIGIERLYRAVTDGRTFDSATSEAQTYRAVNLKPLSPVYLKGSRHPTTNDWTGEFIRRTRVDGAWRDSVDAALGEATESYEIDLYDDGTYTTVLRTINATIPSFSITGNEQFADFGAVQSDIYVKVYQMSATIGRGYPMTGHLTTTMAAFDNKTSSVEYLVVAGGGSGGYSSAGNSYAGGGGGGGGILSGSSYSVTPGSPITVTVGLGGTGAPSSVANGQNSVFGSLTATGGGAGGRGALTSANGNNGGSGGGSTDGGTAGTGTAGQGYGGGTGAVTWGTAGGGGGAGAVGANDAAGVTGSGGAGIASSISGSSLNYGGGGGAGKYYNSDTGGTATHGGGDGGTGSTGGGSRSAGSSGSANTGGGGGGAGAGTAGIAQAGGSGASGVVIIRYSDAYAAAVSTTGSPTVTVSGGYRTYIWTASGSITF